MTITLALDRLRDWLEEAVCKHVELKLPNDDRGGTGYEYKLVHPAAFVMYVPASDKLPPGVQSPIPSICVQLVEGEETPLSGRGIAKVRFCLSAWNPGMHPQDLFIPNPSEGTFTREDDAEFRRSLDAWRDVWNFTDATLAAVRNDEFPAGLRLLKEAGVKYGQFTVQEEIVNTYPYWYAWITASYEYGIVPAQEGYKEFL